MTTELPKILTFERKLEPSDALMYAGNWSDIDKGEEWKTPVTIAPTPRTGRGTKSHYLGDKHDEKPDPNIFEGDDAYLPADKNTLKIAFTLRVIGNLGKPFSCNSPTFEEALKNRVKEFKGIETLALRYAYNIANGRFLWRNRVCADKAVVTVKPNNEDILNFDAHQFSLNDFKKNADDVNLKALRKIIQKGLSSVDDFVFLKINAYVKLGRSQHVFPSQEMNMGDKKKTLFKLNENHAAIHSVKIGNALRTIDTWYGNEILALTGKKKPKTQMVEITEETKLPIAIEPYGAVTHRGSAYRPADNDLYTLLPNWVGETETSEEDKNFIVANLIRGGLFNNESGKKE